MMPSGAAVALLLALATAATPAAAAAAAAATATELRWVLVEVDPYRGLRVVRERTVTEGVVTRDVAAARQRRRRAPMFGVRHDEGEVHFEDPRHVHHEHRDPHSQDWNGTRLAHNVGHVDLRIPANSSLHLFEHPHAAWGSGPRPLGRTHRFEGRAADTLQNAAFPFKPVYSTVQMVAPVDQTYNIVFLAGCYSKANKAKFEEDVNKAATFLSGTEQSIATSGGPLSAQPWNRYYTHINIFSVWDESSQDGANHPDDKGDVADPRPNRLQCSYGTTIKRMLSCNFAETRALASYAPRADLILTLVNDPEYGGAGGGGQAALYTNNAQSAKDDRFEKVLIHEMGHAAADLSDEYDYGFTEERELTLTNCVKSPSKLPAAWSYFKARGTVPAAPAKVCSYSNYYRPTPSEKGQQTCLMASSGRPRLCDVCREGMLEDGLFKDGRKVDLTVPRCPLATETMVVQKDQLGYVHINPMLREPHTQGEWGPAFQITWRCVSAPSGVPCSGIVAATNKTTLPFGACQDATCWPGAGGFAAVKGAYVVEATVVDTAASAGWTHLAARTSAARFKLSLVDDWTTPHACTSTASRDCNLRYGKGSGTACADSANTEGSKEVSCLKAGCTWEANTCKRFFGTNALGEPGYKICAVCDAGADCDVKYTTAPRSAESYIEEEKKKSGGLGGVVGGYDSNPIDISSVTESMPGMGWGLLIAAIGLGTGMLLMLYKTCSKTLSKDRNEMNYTACNQTLRTVILGNFMLLVWGSVAVVGFGVYLYLQTETEIWGSIWMIILIVSGVVMFGLCSFTFMAVAQRGKLTMSISCFFLIVAAAITAIFAVLIHRMATHADDTHSQHESVDACKHTWDIDSTDDNKCAWEALSFPVGIDWDWMEDLRDLWRKGCEDKPDIICKFQNELRCSGFQKACYNVQNSYCPPNSQCPMANKYTDPCMKTLQRKIADNFSIASIVSVVLASLLGLGFLMVLWLTISMFFCARASKQSYEPSYKQVDNSPPTFSQPPPQRPHPLQQPPQRAAPQQYRPRAVSTGSSYRPQQPPVSVGRM
eukprot:Rhum_TRINITY_DN12983_c0_g1::Rhum_TRINITY_DN12983_c0_g1_i1::g.55955::m.55955